MDQGKHNEGYDFNNEKSEIKLEDIDTSRIHEVTKDIELENLIKTDLMNIVTMKENDKDGASLMNEQKDDHSNSFKDKTVDFWNKQKNRLKVTWNGYVEISGPNFTFPMLFAVGMLIYLEIVTHLINYHSLDTKIIYPILFTITPGLLIGFVTGLFRPVVNRVLLSIITGLTCLMYAVQLIYYYIFNVYFSFQSLGMAGEAVSEFGSDIFTAIRANIPGLFLIFLPFIVLGILYHKLIDFSKRDIKLQVVLVGCAGLFHILAITTLLLFGKGDYSPYDLYHRSKVMDLCGKELGITTMTRFDFLNLFFHNNNINLAESIPTESVAIQKPTATPVITTPAVPVGTTSNRPLTPTPVPVDISPNIMDFDFAALAEKENNQQFKLLDQYFATVNPTDKNKYTGMFQGYNLILLTAEGFSPFAVNKEKTPTLYKLTHEGFVFNNFYTALWQTSTSDGEYCALTGLIPTGIRNMYKGRHNLWPFALGNQFDKLGIESRAYHDNTYTYYERNETHPNLGYIYTAKGNGLKLEHPNYWPESDLEMINSTVDDYINQKQFHVYYMTVSGHMNYNFNGNMMSFKNKELVADLPYSEDVKAYIACQIELDKALEQLIKKLEEAGIADHTVIALSADHYPYAWNKSIIDEAAGHKVEPNFELYRNKFILWTEGMKDKVVIDKPCSSLDILPTLSNLFGITYDSRLLLGQDILSDSEPLVILSNRSFITDKVMYNAVNGKITKLTNEELPKDYISSLNKIIKNKFAASESILKTDYYRHLFEVTGK